MGALYHLKQKLVDFCNVIQENVSRTDTVPSSKVVYDLKADTDTKISNYVSNILYDSFNQQAGITNPTLSVTANKTGVAIIIGRMLKATGGTCNVNLYVNSSIIRQQYVGTADLPISMTEVAICPVNSGDVIEYSGLGKFYGTAYFNNLTVIILG